ncbi:MAG: DUF86 domain-containing protein [Phycisphaerales bacterium]|nr:DUF86 domain-containing protein [Phycisphaerales bacterium]
MRRDDATILDVAHAARQVVSFIHGFDRARFEADPKTVAAVLHGITIMGEAVKRLSIEFREAHPDVPWSDIAGMRDRLIHNYDDVDLAVVWDTARRDIPALLDRLRPLLPPE